MEFLPGGWVVRGNGYVEFSRPEMGRRMFRGWKHFIIRLLLQSNSAAFLEGKPHCLKCTVETNAACLRKRVGGPGLAFETWVSLCGGSRRMDRR